MPFFGGGRRRGAPGRQPNQTMNMKLDAQSERELERQLTKIFQRAAKAGLKEAGITTDSPTGKKGAEDPTGVDEKKKQRGPVGKALAAAGTAAAGAAVGGIASFFQDRFSTTDEALARAAQSTAVAGIKGGAGAFIEELTGSTAAGISAGEAAGEATNVAFERLFASGREVLGRAREASTGRLEELAAEGFKISDDEIQRLQRYDLRREKNREEFKLRAARLFEDSASQLGISTSNFRGNEKATMQLQGVNDKLGRLIDLMERRGGGSFRQGG